MSGDFKFDFTPGKTREQKKHEEEARLSEHDRSYRERARQERKRFVNATDTEFWLCFCFTDIDGLREWESNIGFGELHGIYPYRQVERYFAKVKPKGGVMGFGGGFSFGGFDFAQVSDPLAGIQYTGDMEHDCLAELDALHECFVRAKSPDKVTDVTDSDIWFAVAWPDRDSKDRWLADYRLQDVGDKYLDGGAVLAKLV